MLMISADRSFLRSWFKYAGQLSAAAATTTGVVVSEARAKQASKKCSDKRGNMAMLLGLKGC
jgi:hypothetical protein